MLTQHIALVPEDEGVNVSELARVSAALQRQMTRDLAPIWGVVATVDAFPYLEDVPIGYWPVVLTFCELGRQSGVHLDANGQPYAQIRMSKNWSLAASRACLEMLINPLGTRTVTASSLRSGQGPVEYVVEVSGPCADARNAYALNDVLVSDFCTPAYFGAGAAQPYRYSYCGSVNAPLQVLPGGHLTWYDPLTGGYWQRCHFGDNPVDRRLGERDAGHAFVRELLNASAPLCRPSDQRPRETIEQRVDHARRASHVQAHRLRALLGARLEQDLAAAEIVVGRDRDDERVRETPTVRARPRLQAALVDPESEYESVDLAELEEDPAPAAPMPAPQEPPRPAAPQEEPQRSAAPRQLQRATARQEPSRSAAPQQATETAPRTAIPSLIPIAIEDRGRGAIAGFKTPVAFALAGAAVVSAIWIGRATRDPGSVQMPSATPPPHAAASPLPAPATPAVVPAPVSAMEARDPVPAIPPTAVEPPRREPTQVKRRPIAARRAQRDQQESQPRAEPRLPPPLPPPAAPPSRAEPSVPAVEDLIGTRR
jgi:hypothetical protein